MSRLSKYGIVVILLVVPAAAIAQRGGGADQPASAGPFGALRWRSLGPARGGRSIAVAGSDARPYEYYMGATGGGVFKTTDGGTSWKPVTDGLINHSSVGAIAVAASNPDVVYIGTGEADIRGNIIQGGGAYKSADGGKTWAHIGLTDTQVISKIRVHPTNPDLVYVAAFGHHAAPNPDRGVYRSKDGGKTWEKILFRDNQTGANELVLDPKNPQVIYVALWEAYRNAFEMSSGGPGSGLFKSTDGGDHWTEISRSPGLPRATLGKIGGPDGKVIRTFTGTPADAERKPPADGGDEGPRRPPEPHPAVAAGLNRLTWDLRYPGATDFPGLIMWAASSRGPLAAPGAYQVRLTVDGQTETQPFAVRREPRLLKDVTDQDLREEFDLAIKVRDKASQANEAVLLVRGIKAQIDERKAKLDAKSAPVAKALDELAAALSTIENEIYQVKLQSSQDPLNFPIKLNNKIAALQGVIESADVRPTEQAYSVFRTLSNGLDEQLGKLDAHVKAKMPPVNQLLQRLKLDPIRAEPIKTESKAAGQEGRKAAGQ